MLSPVRERRETGGREGMDNRQDEHARRDGVERFDPDPHRKFRG